MIDAPRVSRRILQELIRNSLSWVRAHFGALCRYVDRYHPYPNLGYVCQLLQGPFRLQSERMALVRDRRKHALLGQYIRNTRASVGMTQSMLGSVLGKPQSYIAKIEGGERRVDVIEFIQLMDAMDININDAIKYIRNAGKND